MGWLGYEPEGDVSEEPGARALVAAVRPWELGPGPCAGLLLLHALMAHSRLPHMPAAWLDIAPRPARRFAALGSRWAKHSAGLCFRKEASSRGETRTRSPQTDPRGRDRDRETARIPGDVVISRLVGWLTSIFARRNIRPSWVTASWFARRVAVDRHGVRRRRSMDLRGREPSRRSRRARSIRGVAGAPRRLVVTLARRRSGRV